MAPDKKNLVLSSPLKPSRHEINSLLRDATSAAAISELPLHVDAWIVDPDLEIAGKFGSPFEVESAVHLRHAYVTPALSDFMTRYHEEALQIGEVVFCAFVGRRQKFISLKRVLYMEKIPYIVGYSLDTSDLRDIYDQLLSIREKTFALQSNEKIRVTVDAILSSNIFKMFIKTAGG